MIRPSIMSVSTLCSSLSQRKASIGARWLYRDFFTTSSSSRRIGVEPLSAASCLFSKIPTSSFGVVSSAAARMKSWNKVEWNDISSTSSSLAMCVFTATAVLLSVSSTFSNTEKSKSSHLPSITTATEGRVTESSDVPENEMETEGKIMNDVSTTTLMNWSGTHSITIPTSQLYEPETIPELEQIVHNCYLTNTPIRPIGSALSPNAIAFHHRNNNSNAAMISMVHLNQILAIDKENMTVTVQAGARVSEVIEALRPHGLTLPNLASIAEQQIGGFIQVGAHGTGAAIPPVDEFCTSLKLLTTHMGTLTLSPTPPAALPDNDSVPSTYYNNTLFDLVKVGLGSLGIVTEVTLKCIPAHNLVEQTFVLTRKQAQEQINGLLQRHRHVRYMWIPYQDAVVVVTNDIEKEDAADNLGEKPNVSSMQDGIEKNVHQFEPLTNLLLRKRSNFSKEQVQGMGFGELRDQILSIDPLNVEHVKECNKAEAEFWRRSQGFRIKPSDELLQFDCGGQQWVWEVCFPTGCYESNNGNDMKFMEDLLNEIELHGIPAPAPIEQRWTASSSSLMSPAYSPKKDDLHCWVGIIMYLPSSDEQQWKEISLMFLNDYCTLMKRVGSPVHAVSHWAKLELPNSSKDLQILKEQLRTKYPVHYFNYARCILDPTNLLSNDLINTLFGDPANDFLLDQYRNSSTST